ncbi:MAG TPA: P-type conjugative transfer protein TrbL [Stellaceae bacterium]|nr:P-type conjugative transfer protein TrbL [Stellaceae bacterium]
MGNDIAVIDRFVDVFNRYIDSGFGLISGDVGFLVKVLIGIDVVLAALAWAAGEDEVIQAFAKKILYVGFFAFILNNWNGLAQVIFKSFAALGLKATGSTLSYADFLHPGKLAQAGVQGADVLLAQIQRLSGFPEVFWHLSEIMLMGIAWVVTLVAFFVIAIMLFLALIEFKLTTLKGFILVPFALWRGTSFIAEPVLGQIITSGVRILVFAVVTGIGTQIFTQILPSNPAAELSLQDALTVLLASMTVGALALYAPRIAAGIVSGAPQLGLGAAAAPAAVVGGALLLGGAGLAAAARAGAGAVGSAASLSGGARTAYALGSADAGGEGLAGVGGGLAGVARAGVSAATSGVRAAGGRVADGVADRFAAGERDGWTATGGSAIGEAAEAPGRAQGSRAPGWAQQLRRDQVLRGVERIAREGEASGPGLKPTLRGDQE